MSGRGNTTSRSELQEGGSLELAGESLASRCQARGAHEEEHVEATWPRDGCVERPQAIGGHDEHARLFATQLIQLCHYQSN